MGHRADGRPRRANVAEGLDYNLCICRFKGKGPGGEVDTNGFVSTQDSPSVRRLVVAAMAQAAEAARWG